MERHDAFALAERVVDLITLRSLRMGLITGSVARGLSDGTSDLDIYLYWDRPDVSWLSDPQCFDPIGAHVAFGVPTASGWFTKLEYDGRYIDVESVDTKVLARAADTLAADVAPDGWVIKLAAGLRDAIAVHGGDQLRTWQQRLAYRDQTATAEVAARAGRLLSPTALFELTYTRGDALSFTARLSHVLLEAIALLAAVNRRFVPVDEPKWIPWQLGQLTHCPHDVNGRIHTALTYPSTDTMADLDDLLHEILTLVDTHVPNTSTRSARHALNLRPRPTR